MVGNGLAMAGKLLPGLLCWIVQCGLWFSFESISKSPVLDEDVYEVLDGVENSRGDREYMVSNF